MVDENYIHSIFPHRDTGGRPSYRRHQFEVIRDALSAMESGTETVVIEAPTGSGKTDIAKTVAMYMTRDFETVRRQASGEPDPSMMMSSAQAHMVTSMKMLQDAYLKTAGEVVLLKGKSNYVCAKDPRDSLSLLDSAGYEFTCSDADMFYGGKGCEDRKCPYLAARALAHDRPLALHNFDSFLSQVCLGKVFPHPRALITVDEAHNVEDKIISFSAVEVNSSMLQAIGLKWEPLVNEPDSGPWLIDINAKVAALATLARTEISNLRVIYQGSNRPADGKRIRTLSKTLKICDDIVQRSQRYLSSVDAKKGKPLRWIVDFDTESTRFEPVQGGRFVREALLKWGRKQLLLSATFLDGDNAYSHALKLRPGTTKKFAVPSTFPADRRPVIKRYIGNMGYRDFEANGPLLASELAKIVDENPGRRGVIHCTSYAIAEKLRLSLKSPRLVWHGKDDREAVVKQFLSRGKAADAVLVGVGLTEGYDFAGDLCRFQVLIKIPYPFPSKRLKARAESDPRHMDWRTCLTLVQTYGRGMRSADDYCNTYVLDDRFDRFVKVNKGQLPGWFLESIR